MPSQTKTVSKTKCVSIMSRLLQWKVVMFISPKSNITQALLNASKSNITQSKQIFNIILHLQILGTHWFSLLKIMFGGLKIDFVSFVFVFFLIKLKWFIERVLMVLTFLDTNYVALPYLRESDIMSMTKLSGDGVIY